MYFVRKISFLAQDFTYPAPPAPPIVGRCTMVSHTGFHQTIKNRFQKSLWTLVKK